MKGNASGLPVIIAACIFMFSPQIHGADNANSFRSDSDVLALTGVWSVPDKAFAAAIRNTGNLPIKAFRAHLVALNDFDEPGNTIRIEFSSQAEYHASGNRVMSNHVILPGETVFFNAVFFGNGAEKIYFSSISYISMALGKSVNEAELQGKHLLQVSKILTGDRNLPDEQPQSATPAEVPTVAATPSPNDAYEPPHVSRSPAQPAVADSPSPSTPSLPTQTNENSCVVVGLPAGDYLNVRAAPAMDSAAVFKLANGDVVQVRGESVYNKDTEWVPVASGLQRGWVRNKYLRPYTK